MKAGTSDPPVAMVTTSAVLLEVSSKAEAVHRSVHSMHGKVGGDAGTGGLRKCDTKICCADSPPSILSCPISLIRVHGDFFVLRCFGKLDVIKRGAVPCHRCVPLGILTLEAYDLHYTTCGS